MCRPPLPPVEPDCGQEDQPCCPGDVCSDPSTTCTTTTSTSKICQPCGTIDERACPGAPHPAGGQVYIRYPEVKTCLLPMQIVTTALHILCPRALRRQASIGPLQPCAPPVELRLSKLTLVHLSCGCARSCLLTRTLCMLCAHTYRRSTCARLTRSWLCRLRLQ